ncbi:MAG: HypC/HybG/HupF family hydrogenase formation chaperone [Spirochaetia bacterium]|nr:HypC/HybG/HupF family hydrogenase formation chaperone [Spirochaetota bacterium]MCX8096348.1 HypC/HybG/HupF family hydrogenase formation chaperone [Spirochaetota bacterium]MDW8112291.1 HypC/HybG/HupF family hydrogenase formation chaperone [Spirochaetia bacterium]
MCLGVPGKVVEIRYDSSPLVGKVDFGGVKKDVCLEYVPDVKIGDYVIVHVGFAISRLNEDEAMSVFKYLDEMGKVSEQLGENV